MADQVIDTPHGKFLINSEDGIGLTLKAGTIWDGPGFLQVAAREYALGVNQGSTVLDIGANIGAWTVWLCRMGVERVIACEPIPETRRYLKANLDLNKDVCAERVIVVETAAWGSSTLLTPTTGFDPRQMGSRALMPWEDVTPLGAERILGEPLDRYLPFFGTRVGLIKLDIQGSELQALRGLWATIHRDHPPIIFEAETKEELHEIWTWLTPLRYTVDPWPSQPNNYLALYQGGV